MFEILCFVFQMGILVDLSSARKKLATMSGLRVLTCVAFLTFLIYWRSSKARASKKERKIFSLMRSRLAKMHTPESLQHGLGFKPGPTDVFIVTYPKCGTTWVQQIAHALRTGGSMDFEEICEVIPWTITALDCKQNLNDPQVASPRVFKSHETYKNVQKGGKYIYVMRDPRDVLVSFYKFLVDYLGFEEKDISISYFARALFLGTGSNSGTYWDHVAGWIPHLQDSDVLPLFYEELQASPRQCIRRIAEFMGIKLTDRLEERVLTLSSFDFMLAHKPQFDDHFVRDRLKRQMGIPDDIKVGKVRKDGGKAGGYKGMLPHDVEQEVLDKWKSVGMPSICNGAQSYTTFVRDFRETKRSL
eukprot:g4505.t1